MEILIGTKNSYKVDEMEALLDGIEGLKVSLLADQTFNIYVEENGSSLRENAQKKAKEISLHTELLTLASDGGVDIPGLGYDWDFLKNERTIGKEKTDVEKARTLLGMMSTLEGESRKVSFHFALAIAKNGEILWSDEKVTEQGYISYELPDKNIPKDKWLSHIWYYPNFKKVFNHLNEIELKEVRKQSKDLKESLQKFLLDNKSL
jgi:XTP/dITP diphosphohydrolase